MSEFKGLFDNIALIVVMGVLYSFLYRRFAGKTWRYRFVPGALFGSVAGLIAVVGMKMSIPAAQGVIFDGRSIIISIAGFFWGPAGALMSALPAIVYRAGLGGSGVVMGISVIVSSAFIGTIFHYLRLRYARMVQIPYLYLFSLTVHGAMVALIFTLPSDVRSGVFASFAPPVLLIFPVASVILCKALFAQENRININRELGKSENRYRGIVENMPMLACRYSPDRGRITFTNGRFREFFRVDAETAAVSSFYDYFPEESRGQMVSQIALLGAHQPVASLEIRYAEKKEEHWLRWTNQALFDESGAVIEYQSLGVDITIQRSSVRRIRESLVEKEVLLKEIHHRVKNNMQIISSLLSLQMMYVKDPRDRELFLESQNRVKSMALVHEKLYGSGNLAEIYFDEYIEMLVKDIYNSFHKNAGTIALDIRTEKVILGIDQAIPCALIINELISNAMKYAFRDGRTGTVRIEFRRREKDGFRLSVSDNGVGLPADVDPWNTQTLGLQLVASLVKQLNGTLRLDRDGGASFVVDF